MSERDRTIRTPLLYTEDRTPLTRPELDALVSLNAQLAEVEAFVTAEYTRLHDALVGRCADRRNGLTSFNLEASITLHLREEDPAWSDDDDSYLWQDERYMLPLIESDCRLEERPSDLPPLPVQPCSFMHRLEHPGHLHIPHRDLLRAGRIWVDVHVDLQRMYAIPGPGWQAGG